MGNQRDKESDVRVDAAQNSGGVAAKSLALQGQGLVAYVQARRDYFAAKDLHNGWNKKESGPCCEQCAFGVEYFTGRADAMKVAAACRNPFQIPERCQCHIPVRAAVRAGIVEAHNQLIRYVTSV